MAKAASIIESEDPRKAIQLYLKAYRPGRAARLILSQDELVNDETIVTEVVRALEASELTELIAEIHERIGDHHAAIKAYAKAGIFARALELGKELIKVRIIHLLYYKKKVFKE